MTGPSAGFLRTHWSRKRSADNANDDAPDPEQGAAISAWVSHHHAAQSRALEMQYKSSYVRILDAKRRFLEAATSYYDLSQAQQPAEGEAPLARVFKTSQSNCQPSPLDHPQGLCDPA